MTLNKLLVLAVLAVGLSGCTQTRYLPVETVRDRWHTSFIADTMTIKDSIVIDRAGDTIRETRWRDRWHTSVIRDTIASTDTIREPYPVEVPTTLSPWERAKIDFGGYALAAIALTAAFLIGKIVLRLR